MSPFLYNPGLTEKGVMPPMVDMSSHLNKHNKENPMLLPKSQPNIDCHSSRLTFYTFMVVSIRMVTVSSYIWMLSNQGVTLFEKIRKDRCIKEIPH